MGAVGMALCAGLPDRAQAQKGGGDGFLFRAPRGAVSLRFGVAKPAENSNIFSFTSEQLTIDPGDFAGFSGALDFDYNLMPRLAAQVGVSVTSREQKSEYRDFVDNDDLPIEQRTSFLRVPVTAGFKAYLTPQGRALGRFAWVPSKVAAYVSGGGGAVYYSFKQSGDFVDFQDMAVFPSELQSSGWTGTAYGAAGATFSLSSRIGLVTEARYDWGSANMSSDYQGFERIDLSGMSLTAGLHFRF
jgi:hypothetical protein